MRVFENRLELQEFLNKHHKSKTVGFIPTMGALHKGHLSLLTKAKEENDITITSIFVNPTQFNNSNDLIKYPRTLKTDLELLEQSRCDFVFKPKVSEMYPEGEISQSFNFGGLENEMEGKFRPGHFNGVGTVVKKLLEMVKPTRAYFGEKDYQQLLIIKKMVSLLKMPVTITSCPIYREPNGLAMSSRNKRLTDACREEAKIINKVLSQSKIDFKKGYQDVYNTVEKQFEEMPHFDLEYFLIADSETLEPIKFFNKNKSYRAFIAVNVETVRLIDNIAL